MVQQSSVKAQAVTSSAGPSRRILIASVFALALGCRLAAAQVESDFSWTVPGPGSLQSIADGIEQSRDSDARRAVEEGVLKFAEALIQGVPDGSFPLSRQRRIGPAAYLAEILQLLDDDDRRGLIDKIDLILTARLNNRSNPTDLAWARSLESRLDRDFPDSSLAPRLKRRRAARLLERGDVYGFLALSPGLDEQRVAALLEVARKSTPPILSLDSGDPLNLIRSMEWASNPDDAADQGSGDRTSPWKSPRWIRVPAVDGDRFFWQGDDDLRRLDARSGAMQWKVPFFEHRSRALPGSVAAPSSLGERVVATTRTRVVAVHQDTGQVEWEYPLSRLFPPLTVDSDDPDADNPDADNPDALPSETPALDRDIVAVSAPLTGPHGVLVFALLLRNGYVEGRIARFSADGELRWNRPVGSASGATYLGLGSAQPLLASRGGLVYALPQRGLLAAFDIEDGALQWATRYPAFDPRGSADALRYRDSRWSPVLAATPFGIVATPNDAAALFVFDESGVLTSELPIGAARWISAESGDWPVAAAAPRELTVVRPGPNGTADYDRWSVPASSPSMTGVAVWADRSWWIPTEVGFYRLSRSNEGDWSHSHHRMAVGFDIRRVQPTPAGVWLDGDTRSTLVAPVSSDDLRGDLLIAKLQRARRAVASGNYIDAIREFDEFAASMNRQSESDILDAANRLALDTLDKLQVDETLDARQRQECRLKTMQLFVDSNQGAQVAYREAVAAARRNEFDHAIEFAYSALDASPDAPIELHHEYQTVCELAVRRLLQRIGQEHSDSAAIAVRNRLAGEELGSALRSASAEDMRSVARRFPSTANGRLASIELGRHYYRRGARVQSLWALQRLVELEPDTPEGVRARFEVAAIELELERPNAARKQLEILRDTYGELELSGENKKERVGERATRRLREIRPTGRLADASPPSLPVEFRPVWRTRTELLHQRKLDVSAVPGFPSLMLTTSQRRVALRDARTGTERWIHTINRPPSTYRPDRPRWADELGYFSPPISIERGVITLTDREQLYGLDLQSGNVLWSRSLDPLTDTPGPNDPPTMIERTVGKDGYCVVTANDGFYYAFRTSDGTRLWKERIPGPLVNTPDIRDEHLVCAYHVPAKLEVRSLLTGNVVRNVLLEDRKAIPSDRVGPWFVSDEIAIVASERALHAVTLRTGEDAWVQELPGVLTEVYQFDQLPFFVVEISQLTKGPVLLGIARESGQLLWRRSLGAVQRTVLGMEYSEGHLYVLESNALSRRVLCLDVPRAFRQSEGLDLLPTSDLELVWTQGLGPNWDSYSMIPYREWLLVPGEFRCSLGILDRELGHVLREGPFRLADEFLVERGRLYHAAFFGETLVLITRRGAIGLQRRTTLEVTRDRWRALAGFDPLESDTSIRAEVLLGAALSAYRDGQVDRACQILESALANPSLPLALRRTLTRHLEGMSQDFGEYSPLRITVGRIARSPVIDGSLDEPWNAQTAVVLDSARFFHPMQGPHEDGAAWRGWRDLSVTMFTGWSDVGFHLALDVTDDSIHPYDRDAERWLGDCLLMAFDFAGNGGLRPQRDDQLLTLALTVPKPAPPGGAAGEEEGDDPEDNPDEEPSAENRPSGEFQVNRKSDGSGIIYEVTVPWETFREARGEPHFPFPGTHFGLNLILTDDDTGNGASTYLSLSPGQMLQESSGSVWEVFAPEYFPQLMIGF